MVTYRSIQYLDDVYMFLMKFIGVKKSLFFHGKLSKNMFIQNGNAIYFSNCGYLL